MLPDRPERDRSDYHRAYYLAHREQRQQYNSMHKEKIQEQSQQYYLAHGEKIRQQRRQYYSTHKEEIRERQRQYRSRFGQQFMDGVYGHLCFFCGQEVAPEELAIHHLKGDGLEERKQFGGGSTGLNHSRRKAITEQDPTKWATTHNGCHTRFHKTKED